MIRNKPVCTKVFKIDPSYRDLNSVITFIIRCHEYRSGSDFRRDGFQHKLGSLKTIAFHRYLYFSGLSVGSKDRKELSGE